jgi:hypothetical protein
LGAAQTAKAAGNLLPHFDHAHVLLRQTVSEWQGKIVQEGQNGLLLGAQSVERITRGALLASSFALGKRLGWEWMGLLVAFCQRCDRAGLPIVHFQWMQVRVPLAACLLDSVRDVEQQRDHLDLPCLSERLQPLRQADQLLQVMLMGQGYAMMLVMHGTIKQLL